MDQHSGDVEHTDCTVHALGQLHLRNSGSVELKQQNVACDRDHSAAKHDDPENQLLSCIELVCGRLLTTEHATAALDPFDIGSGGQVAGDPDDEHQHDPDGERETEIVVPKFGGLRPHTEG